MNTSAYLKKKNSPLLAPSVYRHKPHWENQIKPSILGLPTVLGPTQHCLLLYVDCPGSPATFSSHLALYSESELSHHNKSLG